MRRSLRSPAALLALLVLSLVAGRTAAQTAGQGTDPLDALALSDPRLRPSQLLEPFEAVRASLAPQVADGWAGFLRRTGAAWTAQVNRQSGWIESAEGGSIPSTGLPALERTARGFLPQVAPLLGLHPNEMVLNTSRSGQPADHLWIVDFDVHRGGLPVDGARVVFRVNNGHLVQLGTENLPSPDAAVPEARIGRTEALARLADHVGGFSAADTFFDGGSLHLLPVAGKGGRGLALVWQLGFRRAGSTGTWRARVDATSGELLEFLDINRYAEVLGGVYPVSPAVGPETVLPARRR